MKRCWRFGKGEVNDKGQIGQMSHIYQTRKCNMTNLTIMTVMN